VGLADSTHPTIEMPPDRISYTGSSGSSIWPAFMLVGS
jgi:hypothetical protein